MNIDELYIEFTSKMARLYVYQRAMNNTAKKEFKSAVDDSKSREKMAEEIKKFPARVDNMFFYSPITGEVVFFAQNISSHDQIIKDIIFHKNKQYQWILAEAYEVYEDFIESAYAYLGFIDHNSWPLADYGKIKLNELSHKEFGFFNQQAKNKKEMPHSALEILRKHFPDFSKYETDNKLEKNLKFYSVLIEHLRHIIVHNNGWVHDKKQFIEEVIKKAGLFNNGNYKEEYYDTGALFFGANEFETFITLIELKASKDFPELQISRFDTLLNSLMASAYLISNELNKIEK